MYPQKREKKQKIQNSPCFFFPNMFSLVMPLLTVILIRNKKNKVGIVPVQQPWRVANSLRPSGVQKHQSGTGIGRPHSEKSPPKKKKEQKIHFKQKQNPNR